MLAEREEERSKAHAGTPACRLESLKAHQLAGQKACGLASPHLCDVAWHQVV